MQDKHLSRGAGVASWSISWYAGLKRPPVRKYFSDASGTAVGAVCVKTRIWWRFDLPVEVTERLSASTMRSRGDRRPFVTINLLELLGMLVSAGVMYFRRGDRPDVDGDPILLRGDNVSAVSWVNKCGGSRDPRACTLMRLLGRIEVTSGLHYLATHVAGIDNELADGSSRWNRDQIDDHLAQKTGRTPWSELEIGDNWNELCHVVASEDEWDDDIEAHLWSLIGKEA